MLTREEMEKNLAENPEMKEILNKQLAYFFPKWLGEKNKIKMLSHVPENDMNFLFQCILLQNITKQEIDQVQQSENYLKLNQLLVSVANGNQDALQEVYQIYISNVNKVKRVYERKIMDLKYSQLPRKKRDQIDKLKAKEQNDTVKTIIETYNKYDEKVKKIEDGYSVFVKLTEQFDVFQFSTKALQLNPSLLYSLPYAVSYPEFLMPVYVNELLEQKEELPSNWYLFRKLTISEYKMLIDKNNNQKTWNDLFNMAGNSVLDKADIPILPIIKRKKLLKSIIFNFENKYYDSALIIMFSVIEGLLWDLSIEINKKEQVFMGPEELYDCNKKEQFQSSRIRDVIERTAVNHYLDKEFIREFCDELYEERNPVLHGNCICSHNKCEQQGICFIKKLFVLDYLIDTLEEIYQKNLFDEWDKAFDQNKIDEFLNLFYKETVDKKEE